MSPSSKDPIHLHRFDSDTLIPERSWEGNGTVSLKFFGLIFWGAFITGIPLALAITDSIRISSPIHLALMVILPMILSLWGFVQGQWRLPISLAMLVFAKLAYRDTDHQFDLIATVFGIAALVSLIFGLFKIIAAFDGPWIEFKREKKTMSVYKSRINKTLLHEVPFSNLAFGFNIREVKVGKYTTLISYFFSAYDQQKPYELELLFSHSRSESPPPDYLETHGPLCAAVPKFLEEWASGKTAWNMQGVRVEQSEEGYLIFLE